MNVKSQFVNGGLYLLRLISWTVLSFSVQFSSVQSLSLVRLFATPWITARQASLFITISQSSLRLMPIESVMPSSHLILGRPLLLQALVNSKVNIPWHLHSLLKLKEATNGSETSISIEWLLFLEWIELCSCSKLEALNTDNYTAKLVNLHKR